MEALIVLYIAYAIWKATVEAAVNIFALLRGKPVVVGSHADAEAETYRRYAGRGIGTLLGALLWSLAEGARYGWTLADTRYGPKIRAARSRRRHRARWARPGAAPPPDRPDIDEDDEAGDEAGWCCARCGLDLEEYARQWGDVPVPVHYLPGEGYVCSVHLDSHCSACGHPPRDDDPLVLDEGRWLHRSHLPSPAADGPDTSNAGPAWCPVCWREVRLGEPGVYEDSDGDWVHETCCPREAECPACHQPIGYGEAHTDADGRVVHQWCSCATCHRAGTGDDPLVPHDGRYHHQSHLGGPEKAEVVDDDGTPVSAVWEIGPAHPWASVHPTTHHP